MKNINNIKPDFKCDLATLRDSFWRSLINEGWDLYLEDDYPDFKHIVCNKTLPGNRECGRQDVIFYYPENDINWLAVRFHFYFDPRSWKRKEVSFTQAGAETHFASFRPSCRETLNQAGLVVVQEDELSILRGSSYLLNFAKGCVRRAAFTIEAAYVFKVGNNENKL